ncbi:MAG: hypothetical protein II095_02575 [Bacteroidales bacterium]|nr:hypothetical protein [Bacteroidales bacterium]MBQ3872526.1 hypothetical protein [Bacteroidales bacterium]
MTFSRTMRDPIKAAMAGSDLISTDNVAFAWEGNAASLPFSPHTVDAALSYASWAPEALSSNNFAFGAGAAFAERFGVSAGFALDRYSAMGDSYKASGVLPLKPEMNESAAKDWKNFIEDGNGHRVTYHLAKQWTSAGSTADGETITIKVTGGTAVVFGINLSGSRVDDE